MSQVEKSPSDTRASRLRSEARWVWKYGPCNVACSELVGVLQSRSQLAAVLGPIGPKLGAARLHRWVWEPAGGLWDDGHYPEAVEAAAFRLLEVQLPVKLGLERRASSVSETFSDEAHRLAVLDFRFRELQRVLTTGENLTQRPNQVDRRGRGTDSAALASHVWSPSFALV